MRYTEILEFKIEEPKPEDTMGIPRSKMPQVKSDDYIDYIKYLKDEGVEIKKEVVKASDLKAMQGQFSKQGVERQLDKNKQSGHMNPKPLIASSDGYIIDGHHRWLAAVNSRQQLNIIRANVDGKTLLNLTLNYPRVYFKDIYTEDFVDSIRRFIDKGTHGGMYKRAAVAFHKWMGDQDSLHRHNLGFWAMEFSRRFQKLDWKNLKDTYLDTYGDTAIMSEESTLYEVKSEPEVFVDMDGVLVDFFNEWAKLIGVKSYRDIQQKDIPGALKKIVDTPNFWENLPTLSGYKELLQTIKSLKGKYNILSSPLANDPNVDPGKREWIKKHLGFFKPEKVIIDHDKAKYAKQSDGSPNLLIDDYGKNVRAWQSAGGIAIKHHTTTTGNTVNAIKKVFSKKVDEAAGVGRVVPGVNTTIDIGPNEIKKQAKKFGNDVSKDGFPSKMLTTKNARKK